MLNSAFSIQQQIITDLKELFKDQTFAAPLAPLEPIDPDQYEQLEHEQQEQEQQEQEQTVQRVPLKFYAQEVPSPENSDEQALEIVPYCLVRIEGGSFTEWNYTRQIKLSIIFCIYDAENRAGQNVIMDLLEQVLKYYAQKQCINNSIINLPIDFDIQTDLDTAPYYFGGLLLNLESAGVEMPINHLT